jgi:broad specificity phosphatase PhoE
MLVLLALLIAAALATVLYFHKRHDSGSQNQRLFDSPDSNDSDSLDNEVKLTGQYGSMLITQALLKSRQLQQQKAQKSRRKITYSNAGYGVFAQSDPDTDDAQFNYLTARDFGLVLEGSWSGLQQRLHSLNRNPPTPNTRYKLLFLARHGQGYHNLAIEIYGQKAWDDYWSLLDTDGNIVWGPDPELTPLGTEQAKRNNIAWRKQIDDRGILVPKTHYVSPFTRALDTYKETWNRLRNNNTNRGPLIVEDLRETIGVHTCDRRRTRSYIRERYPEYPIEDGFVEEDELWTADYRETPAEQNIRIRRFLDQYVFGDEGDDAMVVGVTAHSGTINSVLEVIGHRKFDVGTGGIIPVLVKAVVEDL